MIERKPIAPKPIRRGSNVSGLKIENYFEKSNQSNPFSLNTTKNKPVHLFGHDFFDKFEKIEKIEKNEDYEILMNVERISKVSLHNSEFENELETEFSNENAKCEILSILKVDSHENLFRSSANLFSTHANTINNYDDVQSERELLRTSMPPMRSSNPFYKNFESENSEEDNFDLIKFNSAKLFRVIEN